MGPASTVKMSASSGGLRRCSGAGAHAVGGGAEGSGLVQSEERVASAGSNRSPLDLQSGYHGEGVRLLLRCTVGGCIDNMHKLK